MLVVKVTRSVNSRTRQSMVICVRRGISAAFELAIIFNAQAASAQPSNPPSEPSRGFRPAVDAPGECRWLLWPFERQILFGELRIATAATRLHWRKQ